MTVATGLAIAGMGVSLYGISQSNKNARAGRAQAGAMTAQQIAFQREQQKKLDAQKAKYRQFKFENPYEGVKNVYAGMENVYEDMTVSTQAADFQMQQGAQQRANIMQGLRGAAGGSGIASLAQAMANQGQLQARQVSVDISKQEQAIQAAKLSEASRLEEMFRKGEGARDMAIRGGEAMVQQAEMDRQATLLGVAYGGTAGANQAVQAAYSNQMAASSAAAQMQGANISALSSGLTSLAGMDLNWNFGTNTTNTGALPGLGGAGYTPPTYGAGLIGPPNQP